MKLTTLQERRLQQAKEEIVLLEKQIRKKGFDFALWFSLVTVVIAALIAYLFEWIIDDKSLADFIKDYGWRSLLGDWAFWFLATCFFIVLGNRWDLKRKRKELAELKRTIQGMKTAGNIDKKVKFLK